MRSPSTGVNKVHPICQHMCCRSVHTHVDLPARLSRSAASSGHARLATAQFQLLVQISAHMHTIKIPANFRPYTCTSNTCPPTCQAEPQRCQLRPYGMHARLATALSQLLVEICCADKCSHAHNQHHSKLAMLYLKRCSPACQAEAQRCRLGPCQAGHCKPKHRRVPTCTSSNSQQTFIPTPVLQTFVRIPARFSRSAASLGHMTCMPGWPLHNLNYYLQHRQVLTFKQSRSQLIFNPVPQTHVCLPG
jgi:hypothetical protein